MCGKRSLLSLAFLAVSLSLYSQSFDPGETYEVSGAWLNERESESKTANEALKNSKAENEKLQKKIDEIEKKSEADLKAKDENLTEVSKRLKEASTLIQNSQNEALRNSLMIGGACLLVGFCIGTVM